MEFGVECVKAMREDRGAEEHDGLASMLGKAGTCAFHASADHGLEGLHHDYRAAA